MEKVSVHIVLPKDKYILPKECEYWYIAQCPTVITDVDDWYQKIANYINNNSSADKDTLYIPNNIYDDPPMNKDTIAKYIFVINTEKNNPIGYHIAYSLTKKYAKNNKNIITEEEYDYILRTFFYMILIFVFTIYLFV